MGKLDYPSRKFGPLTSPIGGCWTRPGFQVGYLPNFGDGAISLPKKGERTGRGLFSPRFNRSSFGAVTKLPPTLDPVRRPPHFWGHLSPGMGTRTLFVNVPTFGVVEDSPDPWCSPAGWKGVDTIDNLMSKIARQGERIVHPGSIARKVRLSVMPGGYLLARRNGLTSGLLKLGTAGGVTIRSGDTRRKVALSAR